MEILKIVLIGIIGAISYIYLKQSGSELSLLCVIATGILIIILTINYVIDTVKFFVVITEKVGVSSEIFSIIIKIIVIAYLVEFCTTLCNDMGVSSISSKVNFAGKMIIFTMALPIFYELFNVVKMFIL